MNVRNITPVDTNVNFAAKMPLQRIRFARDIHNQELPVDDYVRKMIADNKDSINSVADLYDRNVTIAQRNSEVIANSGTITSVIDTKKMDHGKELIDCIINNIRKNGDVSKTGLSILA
jgi:hypothetical protein